MAATDASPASPGARLVARFPELVLAFTTTGAAMLLVELLIANHTKDDQRIGVVVGVFGMLVGLVSTVIVAARIRVPTAIRAAVIAGWAILVLGGLVGVYKHLDGENEGGEGGEAAASSIVADWRPMVPAHGEGGEGGEGNPPPLAPLSFAGLGVLGALAFVVGTSTADRRHDQG